jgi:multidrug efflux pump subunit AcrB
MNPESDQGTAGRDQSEPTCAPEVLVDKGPISWMTRNPVAANLLMAALLIGGLLMSMRLRKEVFPRITPDRISITVAYPGASPAEVEQGILLSIEEAVRPLDGVKEVRSTALESVGMVTVELVVGTDKTKALSDAKNAIDRITSFPNEAERPIVNLPEWRAEAISVALFADEEEKVLHALGERVRDELLKLREVSYVEPVGVRPLEIGIEVSQEDLRRYGLTLPLIADMVRRTAIELPAGGVKTKSGEILLRTAERRDLGAEFADIAVLTGTDGTPVKLGDIANIIDGFAETDVEAAFNGKPAVLLEVYSIGDQSPTDVANAVKAYVKRLAPTLPPGINVATWHDHAKLYNERLDLLVRNAVIGLIVVLLILGLFLEPKLAFWVMMGIPISFLGSLILLPAMDVSINMISLFAFIVTLGMVVDDAIVVGENTFRFQRRGQPALEASIRGTKQVAMPVFFSIATTVVAFSPLLFVPGIRGKIMFSIPAVVIVVLVLSLVESFFVLPAHLGHLKKSQDNGFLGLSPQIPSVTRVQGRFSRGVERFIGKFFVPLVGAAVRQRWITLAIGIAFLLLAFGLTAGGRVKYIDWPREESDRVKVEARLPFGAPIAETRAVMHRMVRAAQEVIAENGGPEISIGIFSMTGVSFSRYGQGGGHVASVRVSLVPSDQRDISSFKFASEWRKKIGDIAGLESLSLDSTIGHYSKPIDLQLGHKHPPELEAAARGLADMLAGYDGVKDIENGIELGKIQMDFKLSPAGIGAGLTPADLAAQVRGAFYGAEAFRQQRGRHEVKVMVRRPKAERETLHSVEEMIVRTPNGGEMPLRQAAAVKVGRAYTSINRTDGRRTIRLLADVDEERANPQEILASVMKSDLPKLMSDHPGLTFGLSGRQRDNRDFFNYLWVAFPLALIVMYLLIAVPLRSYLQPLFVVMAAIPFGYVGAVMGHLIMGYDMSMISLLGVVALSGVVVNDSIVLIVAANRFRDRGYSPIEAVKAASQQRFRPIILTSLTTFGGLAPMIFETSVQARMLIPMAISLGFGVIFSTLVILLLVPSLFVVIENLRARLRVAWDYLFPKETARAGDAS